MGSRVDYDAPGRWCTTMAYSADGTRCVVLTQLCREVAWICLLWAHG